jgi:hypothetical protein
VSPEDLRAIAPADLVLPEAGHSEYAGPPVDGGVVNIDGGQSEYAAPPVDAGDDGE